MSEDVKIFLRGGLGNQLFQYSLGYFLAMEFNKSIVLREDLLPGYPDEIHGVSRWPNQISDFNFVGILEKRNHQPFGSVNLVGRWKALQRLIGDFAPNVMWRIGAVAYETKMWIPPSNQLRRIREVNCYANSLKYILKYRSDISDQVNQIKDPSMAYLDLLEEGKRESPIAIHLRLGDYVTLEHIYGSLSLEYLNASLRSLNGESSTIWLFTENREEIPQAVLQHLKPAKIIDETILSRPIENLVLLSKFTKIVCSNSSFSWWAAILGSEDKKVVFPHFLNRHNVFSEELILPNWLKVLVDE